MELFKEMEEKYIETNGIKLHAMIIGSGEPLILIHGFPDFWYGWRFIIQGLKDKYRLIVPDCRGYNLSDKPEGVENYIMEYLIEDIKELSKELQLNKFNLAGHDWGGAIAWAFAEKYPKLLNKLIICNSPHPKIYAKLLRNDEDQRKSSEYMLKFIKPDSENISTAQDLQFLKLFLFGHARYTHTEFDKQKYIEAWSQPRAITSGLNYYRAMYKFNFEVDLTGIIKVPTLVIWGMRDIALTPKLIEPLPDYIKDLKIITVENASHWILVDDPDLVVSSIKEFIK